MDSIPILFLKISALFYKTNTSADKSPARKKELGEIIMKIALINENSQASKNELRNKAKIAKIYRLFYHSKSKLNI